MALRRQVRAVFRIPGGLLEQVGRLAAARAGRGRALFLGTHATVHCEQEELWAVGVVHAQCVCLLPTPACVLGVYHRTIQQAPASAASMTSSVLFGAARV